MDEQPVIPRAVKNHQGTKMANHGLLLTVAHAPPSESRCYASSPSATPIIASPGRATRKLEIAGYPRSSDLRKYRLQIPNASNCHFGELGSLDAKK